MDKYCFNEQELKLIENSSIPCAVYQFIDKRVVTIAVSDAFRELLGIPTLEETYYLMNNDMYRNVHPDDMADIANASVRFAKEDGEYNVMYRSRVDDEYIVIHAIGKHIYTESGVRLAVVNYMNEGKYDANDSNIASGFNILQDRSFQNKDAVAKVSYDYLTGLPDMDYFFEMAEVYKDKAYSEGRDVAMLFMDMNGMKAFNQKYGYAEGDRLIKAFSRMIAEVFGNENCCRTTADHFAVYTDLEFFESNVDLLVEKIKGVNEGRNLPVRIGMYDTSLGDATATTGCDWAKVACDSCGFVFETTVKRFDRGMLKKFEDRRYILENIDRAISEGWIQVYFQPIVRTANGRVCDEEALARWIDPQRGFMSPADFIPILEDAKIIYKLDLYIAEQVLKKLKTQANRGYYVVPNSINLSRTDFYACDIVEEIRRRVDDSGIDRSKITIEITESVILEDIDFMLIQVNRFRELGFKVWMDDFGSGYSSPDILQKIHFDVVKIDKLFVDQIETSEGSRVIVSELIRLASGLGSETVAEGVETAAQAEFLKEIGCTRLQGYFYCKPIPMEGIFDRYQKGIQIGFENPEESEYYSVLGNVNLYDVSFVSEEEEEDESLSSYFDTMPMFILELDDETIKLGRGNKSYRDFMKLHYPALYGRSVMSYSQADAVLGHDFSNALRQVKEDGKRAVVDVRSSTDEVVNLFIRRIATNPVSGVVAMAVVILGYVDNDEELRRKEEMERILNECKTYSRITALSGNYITLYTIDPETDHFIQYTLSDKFTKLGVFNEGEHFYDQAALDSARIVHPEDLEMFRSFMDKEIFLRQICDSGVFNLNYRINIGEEIKYVCLKATMVEDDEGPQIIVGIVDMDEQVKKDQEYFRVLTAARDIANLDSLTGVKNKHAYDETETRLDRIIEKSESPEFAIAVFDLNGLKEINDTRGHQVGDQFIKDGCQYICRTFQHSPVFRVGGDEFVVISQGDDYKNIDSLMAGFIKANFERKEKGEVVIAAGMSRYNGDRSVAEVFRRADTEMYENKKSLKM